MARQKENLKVLFPLSLVLALVLMALFSACSKATTPSPAPRAPTTAAPTTSTEDRELYATKCAVCHGPSGEGTQAGPAIGGHSMAAVKTQVRNPMGTMPAFPAGQLSDRELEEIAEFISSMGMAKAPMQEWEKQAPESIHHWMALVAIKDGDSEDAKHHIQDALTFIQEPMHKSETEKALQLISQGNIHDAEHEIEEMAGPESPSGISMQRFHLILAQRGVEAEKAAEVEHHLDHFVVKAIEAEKAITKEALELVRKGDLHEAEHEIEELLEMSK